MRSPRTTSRARAFTLVELLVVIAIIGLLAALLLPGVSRAKGSAMKTACISNLKQINLGLRMYADDDSIRIYWNGYTSKFDFPKFYNPPPGYDYKWSTD